MRKKEQTQIKIKDNKYKKIKMKSKLFMTKLKQKYQMLKLRNMQLMVKRSYLNNKKIRMKTYQIILKDMIMMSMINFSKSMMINPFKNKTIKKVKMKGKEKIMKYKITKK